jgi:hypothetical protein
VDPIWIRRLVLCALLASTTVSTYFWMSEQASSKVTRRFDYGEKRFAAYSGIRPEWRARIGATALVRTFYTGDHEVMGKRIAWMFALGFLATGLVYLLLDRRGAPFLILGTFAALYYCGTPRTENTWYPWDAPALFFGALTLLLAVRRQTFALAAAILVASTFKETLLLMALLFAFYEGWTPRQRAAWAGGTFGLGLVLRFALQAALGEPVNHAAFLHVHGKPNMEYRWLDNLRYVFATELNHVAWTNLGLWLLVFFIPTRDAVLRGFKLVAFVGYLGLLLAGSYNEFRVFLEFLPGTLLLAWRLLDDPAATSPASAIDRS